MSRRDIIRAWKDEEYRESLSEAERALLPENPAGIIELSDTDLDVLAGGTFTVRGVVTCLGEFISAFCCFTPFREFTDPLYTVPLQPPLIA